MSPHTRIYLDNAATSWPKPETVYKAVDRCMRELGAPAGRSAYVEAGEVNRLIEGARAAVARILGAGNPLSIAFAHNGTDALNAAIHGAVQDGDHVVTSDAEHNSVLRPLEYLVSQRRITVTHVRCDSTGRVDSDEIVRAIWPETRLVALAHVSNVTGAIQPVAEVAQAVHERGALLLVDAAQSLGHLPLTVADLDCDLLAAPGHKGLLGPLGTGILYIRPGIEHRLRSFRQGGTGTQSESDRHPDAMPFKFEAGNLNVPGIAGLGAGCQYLLQHGIHRLHAANLQLAEQLRRELAGIDGVTLYGPTQPSEHVGVVSMNVAGYDPQEVAAMLDSAYRVQVRAGLHCAARIHPAIGTAASGGTVRFSIGPFNTSDDIEVAVSAIREIAAAAIALR
jgi:cysteine desulfurase family protein